MKAEKGGSEGVEMGQVDKKRDVGRKRNKVLRVRGVSIKGPLWLVEEVKSEYVVRMMRWQEEETRKRPQVFGI